MAIIIARAKMDSLAYLEYVKTLGCVIYGCKNESTAHHRKALGMGSKQRHKEDKRHFYTIPMCSQHHGEIHAYGEEKFMENLPINLDKENLRNLINWLAHES